MRADIDTESVRRFYRRLGHRSYGVTEMAVIDPNGKGGIVATGFFDNEDTFLKACLAYSGRYNIYAGRNPRPRWLPKVCRNYLDSKYKQRAKDSDIEYITAISLDIDPIRPKGSSSTKEQHRKAIDFALRLHGEIGGWVDDSGNGAYLWIPFATPITAGKKRCEIKQKCRAWQADIARVHGPEKQGLRIDGCFDLSRLKKVIGTRSVKGSVHRLSRFVKEDNADDRVRNAILTLSLPSENLQHTFTITPGQGLPARFLRLLKTNAVIQELWLTPNPQNDTSMHDWMLGCELVKSGFGPQHIARILMLNPFGKYQRDRRYDYIQTTVSKLMGGVSGS